MRSTSLLAALVLGLAAGASWAQAPAAAPATAPDLAKAEAAAKAAHAGKVEGYKLCKTMDRVAALYYESTKKAGREVKPPVPTPACADPGPFVFTPPGAAPAVAKK